MDYGRKLEFGVSIDPAATNLDSALRLARLADTAGLDYLAVQDHPYQPGHLDAWTLMTLLTARTERIAVVSDVLDLQLRPPTMLAKAAASLATAAPGRLVLGVGGGATAHGVEAMGGAPHHGGEMVAFTEEAIGILRHALAGDSIRLDTPRHRITGYQAGPVARVPVWLGSQKPRMLAVTGRTAQGWISPLNIYVPPHEVPEKQDRIDAAAVAAGRDPHDIRRMYNVIGAIGPYTGGTGLVGPVEMWVDTLTAWALDLGFDTFVFWPMTDAEQQVAVFASQVVPAVTRNVARARQEGTPR